MKTVSLTILAIILSCLAFSQKIIESPKHGMSTASGVDLYKIELNDTSTVLWFHAAFRPGTKISIPKETFIQPLNGEKLPVTASDGIPLNERYTLPESGKVDYKLFFPKIDKSTGIIDYGEGNEGGTWFIYDIRLNPNTDRSLIPEELKGNWFNTETGDWELSLFDTVAVYKSQIWKYGDNYKKDYLILKNTGSEVRLFVNFQKKGYCQFGESSDNLKTFASDVNKVKAKVPANDKPFEEPVFTMDSAVFSGYINGYTPRAGIKTGTIAVNNILTGNQNTFLIKINEDGSFSVKIPMFYPEICYIRSAAYNGFVFLVPGKEVFMMLTLGEKKNKLLFMGEYGKLNKNLDLLEKINSLDYSKLRDSVLYMTPASYKSYILAQKQKDMDKLGSYQNDKGICAKAYQVKKLYLEYRYASVLMEYDMNYQSAYMRKNKIAPNQRMTPVRHDTVTAEYYDFLTNDLVNNPLAIINSDYFFFINRLMYMELVRPNRKSISFRPEELAEAVVKEGYSLTPEEKNWIEAERQKESSGLNNEYKKFMEENGEKLNVLRAKFKNNIQELYKTRKDSFSLLMLEKYLIDKGVNISEDEKALFSALRDFEKTEYSVREREFQKKYTETMKGFYSKYNNFMNSYFKRQSMETRKEVLEKQLGIKPGLATDIMTSQDELRSIVQEMTPVSDSAMNLIRKEFVTPFIADYVAYCNEQMKARLSANKNKSGYTVNEVPKIEADKLFESIMKKYRGKVVYVDFWATWCAPCRSGMERIKPLKEEMAGENVVFVYITNQTSPKETWENMIPDISGEHFRVSEDEWNYLCDKFNISGIPHYVLVGKDGAVINPDLSHLSNETLKVELMKYIKN